MHEAYMRNLYSVRIIRKESQAVQAVYIEEFWKFCGVYTSEYITEYSDTMLDEDIVDCNIILDEDAACLSKLKAEHSVMFSGLQKYSDLSSGEKRKRFGRKLDKELLSKIAELFEWNKEWKQDFKKLSVAFIQSDFAYNNYLTRLFLNQFSDDMKLIQIEILNECMDMIYTLEENLKMRWHISLKWKRKTNRKHRSYIIIWEKYPLKAIVWFLNVQRNYSTIIRKVQTGVMSFFRFIS